MTYLSGFEQLKIKQFAFEWACEERKSSMGCKKRSTLNIHEQDSCLTLVKNKCIMDTAFVFCFEIFDVYSGQWFQVLMYNLDG